MTRPGAVYRHYNAAGELLYIGSSYDPAHRCESHISAGQSEWITDVSRIEIEWFSTIDEARAAEKRAIAAECPPNNYRDNPKKPNVRKPPVAGPILARWLEDNDVSVSDFAVASGISVARLERFMANVTNPNYSAAIDIRDATGGDIPTAVWARGGEIPPHYYGSDRDHAEALLARLNGGDQ